PSGIAFGRHGLRGDMLCPFFKTSLMAWPQKGDLILCKLPRILVKAYRTFHKHHIGHLILGIGRYIELGAIYLYIQIVRFYHKGMTEIFGHIEEGLAA